MLKKIFQAKRESDQKIHNLINQRHAELMELLRRESNVREENLNLLSGTLEVNFFYMKFINPSHSLIFQNLVNLLRI